jgi:hypothetical protein
MATELISNKGTNGEPVTDKDGNPIENAEILAVHHGGRGASDGDIFRTFTDANGEYAFTDADLPATYTVGNTKKTEYVDLYVRIGSRTNIRRATPIRPWQPYSLSSDFLVIDTAGDGDIAEYSGTTSDFFVSKASPVFEGDYSIKSQDNANRSIVSYPSDSPALDNYPTRGDRIRYYYYATNNEAQGGAVFFAESGTTVGSDLNGYVVYLDMAIEGNFQVIDGKNFDILESGGQTPSTGVWYEVNIYSNSSEIRVTFENLSTNVIEADLSVSDATYSGSGFGWKKRDAEVFDNARYLPDVGLSTWSFSKADIDPSLTDADAFSLADLNGDGKQDAVAGNGTGGDVIWYEQGSDPTLWTEYNINSGYDEIEGVGVGDVDGDGDIEVGICDQKVGEFHLAKMDTSGDPTGSWTDVLIDSDVYYIQTVRFFDIDGDGDPEPVYAFSGDPNTSTGGGVRWAEYTGGAVTDGSNWTVYDITTVQGAYWLPYERKDLSGDGNATDLWVTARAGTNYEGGIHVLEAPSDPTTTTSWTKRSYDTGTGHLIGAFADLSGDGNATDIVSHDTPASTGNVWLNEYDGTDYTTSQFGGSSDKFNNAHAHDWSSSDVWDLVLFNDTQGELQFWIHDGTDWVLEGSVDGQKVQDDMYAHDFSGDGVPDLATVGVISSEVFWVEVNPP